MSRSGYSDDISDDPLAFGRWRALIRSATKGKRGQHFFKSLVEALDAMPEKKLVTGELQRTDGCLCTLGALAVHRGIDPMTLDTEDWNQLGKVFDVAEQLTQEVMFENDEAWGPQTPEERWLRMRNWAAAQAALPAV